MNKLLRIDELLRQFHSYLSVEDECYYLMNYRPREGATYSEANQLIYNFKKPLRYKDQGHWKYKKKAIDEVSRYFREAIITTMNFDFCTLVPIPPSKEKGDAEYDDRMSQVLSGAFIGQNVDFRELICCKGNIAASHDSPLRPSIGELYQNLYLAPREMEGLRDNIVLFDDMLTTGAHFKACQSLIQDSFPEKRVLGIFIARRDVDQITKDFFDDIK
ncbi:hypothetical protein SAMN04487995_0883 [Dyadobacter koreensis]|uniref:Phosphoribosyl transferase domain-containing protein n=1 Tax=Dyadobacter koreensis TaxID=408657 RepID=A0A1H6R1R1_9BACT|nr:hypothetical protein [Dyadobacter koreensis]SEI45700.1 hypothetical protein SAMN04487995_0883 [Dyadobacter koreensis]